MSRLYTLHPKEATGQAAELFASIKTSIGMIPNTHVTIGSNSPAVLAGILAHDTALKSSSLSAQEIEAINLVVSETTGCSYCLAAHTALGKMAGFTLEQTKKLRTGRYDENFKLDALVHFAHELITTRGEVPDDTLAAIRAVGYNDTQIVEVMSAMGGIFLYNLINRVAAPALDFPKID
ncbi:carboxymuconolactone decarboxylase family protein [Pseudomonas sp. Irchel 3A7]|uniref:carboxymuconolactone decarboxylase family protein n=1 Tax=Pseudomonas sp. Irchel 3A7 TaxID=2008913 RepID=UPI000BA353EB|nr:carboxymuconolactone decarboxylase family protein [Pseudomonas sp. Irchel 3A7]